MGRRILLVVLYVAIQISMPLALPIGLGIANPSRIELMDFEESPITAMDQNIAVGKFEPWRYGGTLDYNVSNHKIY